MKRLPFQALHVNRLVHVVGAVLFFACWLARSKREVVDGHLRLKAARKLRILARR
jgi:hypothetical protein